MNTKREEILPCGCERIYVDGRCVTVLCDEHDDETHSERPEQQLTKFKKHWN